MLSPTPHTSAVDTLISSLNPSQKQAAQHNSGPMLILAGAGSGKTRVLTCKIARLIETDAHPAEILAVTFTNKAAKEMRARVEQLLGEADPTFASQMRSLWIGTFHSVCGRILRRDIDQYTSGSGRTWQTNFVIYDTDDTNKAVKEIVKSMNLDDKLYNPKTIRSQISTYKNQGLDAYKFATSATDFRKEKLARIYDAYEAILSENNALDFDDLLLVTVNLLQNNPDLLARYHQQFRHVLVDEFQDTNNTQYELIRLIAEGTVEKSFGKTLSPLNPLPSLSKERENGQLSGVRELTESDERPTSKRSLTVVGDVDQSIYSWRGANFRIILDFQSDFPQANLVKLMENYRSTANILNLANAVINNNTERLPKELISTKGDGSKITCYEAKDDRDEAMYILDYFEQARKASGKKPGDCCILYRTNVQSRALEDVLMARGVPYTMIGGLKFYERREIKDVLAYLTLIFNPADSISVKRVLNVPKRGIGKTSIDYVDAWAKANQTSFYDALSRADQIDELGAKAARAMASFVRIVEDLRKQAQVMTIDALMLQLLDQTGYVQELKAEDPDDSENRLANVEEFVSVARQFHLESVPQEDENGEANNDPIVRLADFLTQMALLGDIDTAEPAENKILLMTLHAAKGLEYPIVAIAGLEEGLFPHGRSLTDKEQMEEERRLMYVGVTRAEQHLLLAYARRRLVFGELKYNQPSRFLHEAPPQLLTGNHSLANDPSASRTRGEFDRQAEARPASKPITRSGGSGSSSYGGAKASGNTIALNPSPKPSRPTPPAEPAFTGLRFDTGDRVTHPKYGVGTIMQTIGKAEKAVFNIQFDALNGKKLIDPKFAKLEPG
jgi:DNA helicase II / ATP-dependent DNA helicase PcrA